MIPNNNLSVLPWYTSIEQQNARKWWTYGKIYPLFTPAGFLLPFQIMRNHRLKFTVGSEITPDDYETLFGESLNTQDVEIMMYIDNDGQLKKVEESFENIENHSLSSEEFQIMKAKIQNNSENFIEEGLGITPEAEEYSDAKEMFNAVLKADNESDFIAALNDFRDNLLGGAFAEISDTDLAKYLDDIYDTYDSDGNLRNVCNIITVLK